MTLGGGQSDRYKWVALSNTTLGTLIVTIDISIVIIAMPAIFRGIGLDPLSPANIGYLLWMILGYLLVSAVLVVSLGRLGDMFGRVRMYNLGFAIFSTASVALSFDPTTSVKRLSLTICVVATAASLMLLPKSQQELMHWFAIAALALLAICYLGILLAPDLSIHLATDPQEPGLAGNWRGAFGHKNMAAAVMPPTAYFDALSMNSRRSMPP